MIPRIDHLTAQQLTSIVAGEASEPLTKRTPHPSACGIFVPGIYPAHDLAMGGRAVNTIPVRGINPPFLCEGSEPPAHQWVVRNSLLSGSQTANKEAFDMTHANSAHNALREIRKTLDDMDAGLLEIRSLASALVTVLDQSKQDASAHETVHVLARLLHERAISPDLSADRTNHNLCVVYDCLTAKEFGHA